MRKMIKNYWKKALSMMLIAALLIQILPATAKGAEIDASADAVTYAAPSCELQTGLSDMYEYQTYDVGKAGTLYLNTYSGYPHVKRTDFTYGGERMPVEISFYFDPVNDFTTNNPYGAGWSSCYNQLVEYDTESTQYKYKNGNGTWIYFSNSGEVTEDGDEIWTEDTTYGIGETGATLYRKPTAALSNYVAVNVIHMDKTYSFDSLGRLTSINDGVNEITISYITSTSAIKKIVDPLGRMFCFEYGSYLTAIQVYDHLDGPYTKINYKISGGKLINVVYGSAGYVNYNYDTICQLIRLRDMDGCGYELNYGKLDVASCITQKAGMGTSDAESGVTVSIEHPTTTSTIITSDSTRQTYKFDGCGRITNSELENLLTDGTYQTVYGYNMTYDYISDEDGAVVNSLVDVEYYDANGIIEEDAKGSTEEETAEETTVEVTEQDATEEETEESEEVYEDYITTTDDYGNILTETHIVGDLQQVTKYTYSMYGNYLASVTDADGREEKYTYENWDGLITTITDGNGNQTNYTYNALRELASVQMNVSGLKTLDASTSSLVDASETMDVVYDYEKGRLTSISYGDCIYLFTYDKWGNILSVTMDDTMLVTYEYGENACKGLVSTITYGNGQSVYYTYNNLGQVVTVGYVENEVRFTYTYASDGTLENVYDTSQCVVTKYTEDGYQIYMGTPESVSELLYEYAGAEDNYVETVLGQVLNIEVENDERVTLQKVLSDVGVQIFSEQTVYDAFERLGEKVLSTGRIMECGENGRHGLWYHMHRK